MPVTSPAGAYAWAVLDEGVKVRINTPYTDGAGSVAAKTQQLGSGERPGVEFIPGLGALWRGYFNADAAEFADFTKGIGDSQFGATAERLAPGTGDVLKSLTHDVSLHSLGLFTDTARGGFKQDLQLLMNSSSLPAGYAGNGVYKSRLGMTTATAPSDPRWESLQQFARLYRDKITNSGGVPVLKTQTPTGWAAVSGSGTTPIRTPPAGVVLQPTIAKVQMLFSLIGRDLYANLPAAPINRQLTAAEKATGINGPQNEIFRDTRYDYLLHLLYTPWSPCTTHTMWRSSSPRCGWSLPTCPLPCRSSATGWPKAPASCHWKRCMWIMKTAT